MKQVLGALGVGASVLVAAWLAFVLSFAGMGRSTPYCPIGHRISDASSCVVLDADGKRLLIQHADLDINDYYLEIRESDGRSRYFELPISDGQLAPQGYSASLIPESDSAILVNGQRHDLEPQ